MPNDFRERLEKFLTENNQSSELEQLTQDASTREYFRVRWNGNSAIACVYPFNDLCKGQFEACLDVTSVFLSANLPVAQIFASDAAKGIIIHEDFGNTVLRDVLLNSDKETRDKLLDEAIGLIAKIQTATPKAFEFDSIASRLKFDEEKLLWELNFFKEHYFTSLKKQPLSFEDDEKLTAEFIEIARELETKATVLCHRDFHAANLMIDEKENLRIIDHQDARLGSAAYDLVSLLLDRVSVAPEKDWVDGKKRFFLNEREKLGLEKINADEFDDEFDLQAIQRCLKAAGTFSYQSTYRAKTYFVPFIKPMFQIVLQSAQNLERFPNLQRILEKEI